MLSRRRRAERGQTLIAALAFIAFFGVVTAATLTWASGTQRTISQTEQTATGDALAEAGAAFAAANAQRTDLATPSCTSQATSQIKFTNAETITLQTNACNFSADNTLPQQKCSICAVDSSGQPTTVADTTALTTCTGGDCDADPEDIDSYLGSTQINGNLTLTGAGMVGGGYVWVSGSQTGTGSWNNVIAPGGNKFKNTGVAITDPLSAVPVAPLYPASGKVTAVQTGGSRCSSSTINPGWYSGGISLASNRCLTLNPGVYVFTGDVTLANNSELDGSGVTLYFACASYPQPCSTPGGPPVVGAKLNILNGATTDLTGPTSGAYNGLLVYYDRGNSAGVFLEADASDGGLDGSIYALSSVLDAGNSVTDSASAVVDHFAVHGSGTSLVMEGSGLLTTCSTVDSFINPGPGAIAGATKPPSAPNSWGRGRVVTETNCRGGSGIVSFTYGAGQGVSPPSVSLVHPAGGVVVNTLTPAVDGTLTTNYVGTPAVTVSFCGGNAMGCATPRVLAATISGTTWTATIPPATPLTSGFWTAQATLSDTSGETVLSTANTFRIVIPPTVQSITATPPTITTAASVTWTVTFSAPVTGVTAANFTLVPGGGLGGAPAITSVTQGAGSTWTVTASAGTGNGTLGLNLTNDVGITDAANTQLANTLTGDVFTLARIPVPAKLVFTTGSQIFEPGNTSGTITVQQQTASGNPIAATSAVPVTLSTNGQGTFTPGSPITIAPGRNSVSFTYRDTSGDGNNGPFTITAQATGLTQATQVETLTGDETSTQVTVGVQSPSTIAAGQSATFQVTVKNTGGSTHDYSLTSESGLPAGATSGVTAPTCFTLAAGNSHVFTLTVSSSASTPSGASSLAVVATRWNNSNGSCGGGVQHTGQGNGTLTISTVVGPPAQLLFTQQPGGGSPGVTWAGAAEPAVTIMDAAGNTVSTTHPITLAIGTNPGGGTLSGCTGTTVGGVAIFSGCRIDKAGTGYTLVATDAGDALTSAASAPFSVVTRPTVTSVASKDDTASDSSTATSAFSMTAGTTYVVVVGQTTTRTPNTPSLSIPGNPATTLIAGRNYTSDCNNHCNLWSWWFTASSTQAAATVTVNYSLGFFGQNTETVVDVLQVSGNSATTPIATANTSTAQGSGGETATANLGSPPAAGDVAVELIASDGNMGSGFLSWNPAIPAGGNVFQLGKSNQSLGVYVTSPAAQNESTNPSFNGDDAWATIAFEINHG